MPARPVAQILTGTLPGDQPQLSAREIGGMASNFHRKTSWLGPYADPREYAVELGLRVSRQPLPGSTCGAELVGDLILYRGDVDTRIWGGRVFLGIAVALLGVVFRHRLAERACLVGHLALGALIAGEAAKDDAIERQVFCPRWLLRATAEYIQNAGNASGVWPIDIANSIA